MKKTQEKTVKSLVEQEPSLIEYFEIQGIDYCCGGDQTLKEAIESRDLESVEILSEVNQILADAGNSPMHSSTLIEPSYLSVSSLIQYITDKHHSFTRYLLEELDQLTEKIAQVHGHEQPELKALRTLFETFKGELTKHLQKEELYVFPSLIRLEKLSNGQVEGQPSNSVESLWNDIGNEHTATGEVLHKFEELTSNFTPPEHACESYRRTYSRLKDLTRDIHLHVHLEEHILLPKAQWLYQNLK